MSTWIPTWHGMDHVSWSLGLFSKPPLGGRPNTKPGNRDTPNTHNRWFILFQHVWWLAWIETYWNSIWLQARSHMAFTLHLRARDHTTWLWRCLWMAFGHFLLDSHNFTATALGSCVKLALNLKNITFKVAPPFLFFSFPLPANGCFIRGCYTSIFPFSIFREWGCGTLSLTCRGPRMENGEWRKLFVRRFYRKASVIHLVGLYTKLLFAFHLC